MNLAIGSPGPRLTSKESTVTTNDSSTLTALHYEEVAARDAVAAGSEPIDFVPRIRPLLRGGCSDLVGTVKHFRREHARAVRAHAA